MNKNKNIFNITHEYANGEKVIIETILSEDELIHLIKIWQIKTWYILDTFDLFPEEIYQILQYCNCKKHNLKKDENAIEINLYEIWEDADIKVSNDDLVFNKYVTINATKEFLNILLDELSVC